MDGLYNIIVPWLPPWCMRLRAILHDFDAEYLIGLHFVALHCMENPVGKYNKQRWIREEQAPTLRQNKWMSEETQRLIVRQTCCRIEADTDVFLRDYDNHSGPQ